MKLEKIDGYIMSPDEKKMLIQTETKPIYRHSFTAVYYLYDIANRTLSPLSDNGPSTVAQVLAGREPRGVRARQ